LTAACGGGGGVPIISALAPQHLYVAAESPFGTVSRYTLPITSASSPDLTIRLPYPSQSLNPLFTVASLAVDPSGDVAVGSSDEGAEMCDRQSAFIQVLAAPLSAASTPAATFANGTCDVPAQLGFVPAGNSAGALWALAGTQPRVYRYMPPLSGTTVATGSLASTVVGYLEGVAFDPAATMYLASNAGPDSVNSTGVVSVYAPPYTAPRVTTPAASYQYGVATAGPNHLFILASSAGRIDVFRLPITATSTAAFSIHVGSGTSVSVAADAEENLYVGGRGTVSVYAAPQSAASVPAVVLNVPGASAYLNGLAIGK
jgi:hypothetical protein